MRSASPLLRAGIELVAAGGHQQTAARCEGQAGGADDAGGLKLNGAGFVTLRVVDVGVRHAEGDPQVALRIDTGGADDRQDERHLSILDAPSRPAVRLRGEIAVQFLPLYV